MKRYYIAFSILIFTALARAQQEALTWQDCVRETARHNPDLLSSLQALESSRAQYKGSYNGLLPSLTVSNSYTDSSSRSGNSNSSDTENWAAAGTANLNLFNLAQWANIQIGKTAR